MLLKTVSPGCERKVSSGTIKNKKASDLSEAFFLGVRRDED